MTNQLRGWGLAAVAAGLLMMTQWSTHAQPGKLPEARPAKPGTRHTFEVVESFDAKYEGDTPGHIGRAGGLDEIRPNVALGDPVFHNDKKAGTITNVVWSRAQGSLAIEFDPEPNQRIAVGDIMTLDLNPVEKTPAK